MMAANHAHNDTGAARNEYIDVFTALGGAGICCIGKPWRNLAGAYAGEELGGPVVMVNSMLDEVALRHTAGHELGHHCFGHDSRMEEHSTLMQAVSAGGSPTRRSWPRRSRRGS